MAQTLARIPVHVVFSTRTEHPCSYAPSGLACGFRQP